MEEKNGLASSPVRLGRYAVVTAAIWTVCILLSLIWNLKHRQNALIEVAKAGARVAYEKDILYRRWNAENGGVYAPVSKTTPPNPYLEMPGREISAPSGVLLTKINPAYMTRLVHELGNRRHGVRGHITSANPINPGNMPDPWEAAALKAFEQGAKEVSSIERIDGESYLRLMGPLVTEEGCLKCHAKQGYKRGDIRGGISVSLPMVPLRKVEAPFISALGIGHGLLWIIGLAGIGIGVRRLSLQVDARWQAEEELRSLNAELVQREKALRESEARFKDVSLSMADWIWETDEKDRYIYASGRVNGVLGYEPEELLGKTPFDFMPEEEARRVEGAFRESTSKRQPIVDLKNWNLKKDGTRICLQTNGVPVIDEAGELSGYRGVDKDITRELQAEGKLKRSLVVTEKIIENMPIGVVIVGKDKIVQKANREALTMMGRGSSREIVGHPCHKNICPADENKCPVIDLGQTVDRSERVVLRRDGRLVPVYKSVLPLILDGQEVQLEAFVDISELKKAENALRELNADLEQRVENRTRELEKARAAAESASRAKSLFIANMSHELRTPLNGIIVSADLALGQKLSPKVEKIQQIIRKSGILLMNVVNNILDFSKSEDGALDLKAVPFRLDEVLGRLTDTFYIKGVQKRVDIQYDIAGSETPNALVGDPGRLVDIFQSLLDNAAKFCQDEPAITLGINSMDPSRERATLEFYVRDRGIGIAREDFERIFEPFVQVDASSTRKYDGMGMGLATARRLVERMGGTIRVESEIGKGSTFFFAVPFHRQEQEHPFEVPCREEKGDVAAESMDDETCSEVSEPRLLLELLSTLDPFLQKCKPKDCKKIVGEIGRKRWPDGYAKETTDLAALIKRYKFKEAKALLDAMTERLMEEPCAKK